MKNAGAFDAQNRANEWSYMNENSKGNGGVLDFSYGAIRSLDPEVSKYPLETPSPMLFVPAGDGYAHNHMNFGNFLWGAAGHSLGFSKTTLGAAAHVNSLINPRTNGYLPQFDSRDDQRSIRRGVNYSNTHGYRSIIKF